MLLRAGRAEAGDTLAPTVTLPQTVKGQRNEGDPEPYHERISKVSVMQRSGGDYLNNFHCVFFFTKYSHLNIFFKSQLFIDL